MGSRKYICKFQNRQNKSATFYSDDFYLQDIMIKPPNNYQSLTPKSQTYIFFHIFFGTTFDIIKNTLTFAHSFTETL
jgi:hypothetical protein